MIEIRAKHVRVLAVLFLVLLLQQCSSNSYKDLIPDQKPSGKVSMGMLRIPMGEHANIGETRFHLRVWKTLERGSEGKWKDKIIDVRGQNTLEIELPAGQYYAELEFWDSHLRWHLLPIRSYAKVDFGFSENLKDLRRYRMSDCEETEEKDIFLCPILEIREGYVTDFPIQYYQRTKIDWTESLIALSFIPIGIGLIEYGEVMLGWIFAGIPLFLGPVPVTLRKNAKVEKPRIREAMPLIKPTISSN